MGPSGVGVVEMTPDPAPSSLMLALWKSFGFTGPVVNEAFLCRVSGSFWYPLS